VNNQKTQKYPSRTLDIKRLPEELTCDFSRFSLNAAFEEASVINNHPGVMMLELLLDGGLPPFSGKDLERRFVKAVWTITRNHPLRSLSHGDLLEVSDGLESPALYPRRSAEADALLSSGKLTRNSQWYLDPRPKSAVQMKELRERCAKTALPPGVPMTHFNSDFDLDMNESEKPMELVIGPDIPHIPQLPKADQPFFPAMENEACIAA
jgi:hypothetical protein